MTHPNKQQHARTYYLKHGDYIRAKARAYYRKNRPRVLARRKARYAEDPQAAVAASLAWARDNPEKRAANLVAWQERHRVRMETDETYRAAHLGARRSARLKSLFGMSGDDYQRLLEAQCGACGVCRREVCPTHRRLSVDHCHKTGKIRGLLCMACNIAIGKMRDDPELLERAAEWVRNGGYA